MQINNYSRGVMEHYISSLEIQYEKNTFEGTAPVCAAAAGDVQCHGKYSHLGPSRVCWPDGSDRIHYLNHLRQHQHCQNFRKLKTLEIFHHTLNSLDDEMMEKDKAWF